MFVYSFFSAAFSSGRRTPVSRLIRHSTCRLTGRLQAVYAGNPLTPGGYAILAMTALAVALVAMLSLSCVSHELEKSLRVSWWFS
jgi:hypothetical protein